MHTQEDIGLCYLLALGTPFPVGTSVRCNGCTEVIEKYEFKIPEGLLAITDSGKKISDYNDIADAKRKLKIREFFAENANLKLSVNTATAKRFYEQAG